MPADKGVRLDDRQRIANFREQPIETNEYHSVDGAEGEFLWSSSPQNVDLLPQRPNLCLKHYARPDQIHNHPTNEPAKIPHCTYGGSMPSPSWMTSRPLRHPPPSVGTREPPNRHSSAGPRRPTIFGFGSARKRYNNRGGVVLPLKATKWKIPPKN